MCKKIVSRTGCAAVNDDSFYDRRMVLIIVIGFEEISRLKKNRNTS